MAVTFVCIFIFRNKRKVRNTMLVVTIVLAVIWAGINLMCMYTYIEIGSQIVEDEFPGKHDITVEMVDGDSIRFTNNENEPYELNEFYKLERQIERNWFYVSTEDDVEISDLTHDLLLGQSIILDYDTSAYGELEPGHYRFACQDDENKWCYYYVEFDVLENGDYSW